MQNILFVACFKKHSKKFREKSWTTPKQSPNHAKADSKAIPTCPKVDSKSIPMSIWGQQLRFDFDVAGNHATQIECDTYGSTSPELLQSCFPHWTTVVLVQRLIFGSVWGNNSCLILYVAGNTATQIERAKCQNKSLAEPSSERKWSGRDLARHSNLETRHTCSSLW